MKFIISFLVIIMTSILANAEGLMKESFDKVIAGYQKDHLLNADILISQNGKVIYHNKIGFADIDTQEPFTDYTLFPIASLSKQFIAAAILLLKDDKKLELHQPITTYLPESHSIWQGKMPSWAYDITIHQLLTHTSGLPNFTEYKWEGLENLSDKAFVISIINKLKNKKLLFKPGTKFEYNNTSFLIMGAIIEELSLEKNLSSFLENRIFKPLGMSHTYLPTISEQWRMITQPNQDKKIVTRYTADIENSKTKLIRIDHIAFKPPLVFRIPVASAGAIISCMSDLVKWQESLYGGKILSADSLKAMTTGYIKVDEDLDVSGEDMYGYGLMTGKIGDKKIYYHGGWLLGVRTIFSYNPENGVSVIALSNLSPADNQWKRNSFRQVGSFTELALELQGVVPALARR